MKDGLQQYFSFYCEGTVIDPSADLQELRLWACVSTAREMVPAEPDPKDSHFILKGTLIEQDIRTNIQQSLLLAYAEGLDSPTGSALVQWLNLEKAE